MTDHHLSKWTCDGCGDVVTTDSFRPALRLDKGVPVLVLDAKDDEHSIVVTLGWRNLLVLSDQMLDLLVERERRLRAVEDVLMEKKRAAKEVSE